MPAQNQDTARKNLAVHADGRESSSVFRGSGAGDAVVGVWEVSVYGNLVRCPGHDRTVSAEVFTDHLHTCRWSVNTPTSQQPCYGGNLPYRHPENWVPHRVDCVLEASDGLPEEPVDINEMSRKAKNTKDDQSRNEEFKESFYRD